MSTISILLGLFNICAGVMVVASLLAFLGGFARYLVLLGTERRQEGLVSMVWGVVILFVLVVLLGVVNIVEGPLFYILAIAGGLFLCIVVVLGISRLGSSPPDKEHS